MEPLNTNDINASLNCAFKDSDYFIFRGCTPGLPSKLKKGSAYVINSDDRGPGEHWLYADVNWNGRIAFFDSYGFKPDFYRPKLLQTIESIDRNYWRSDRVVQALGSMACGYHVIAFASERANGEDCASILNRYYTNDLELNDAIAQNHYEDFC